MRWRLVAILVGFTTLVLAVQNIPLSKFLEQREFETHIAQLQSDAYTIAGWSIVVLETPSPEAKLYLSAHVAEYAKTSSARVVVVDQTGTVIEASDSGSGENFTNRPEIEQALTGQAASGERMSQSLGEPLIYVAVPVRAGPKILGAVRLTYPSSELQAQINDTVRSLFSVGLISLLSAALIAFLMATAITRRIRRLSHTAERIAEGDLAARVDDSGGGEIEELATSFNIMAERVQGLVEKQRDFAGDASHQLRTPLTALRLRMDRTVELMDLDDPAVEQVEAARNELDRLQRLVDGLLALARADSRNQRTVPMDISSIARDRVDSWRPLADEQGVQIEFVGPAIAMAQSVPTGVEQVLDNYIDNALEVVPAGGRVVVTVTPTDQGVLITVDDNGPGLSPEDRVRAFDRFWRGRQDDAGSGLGLAVVSALVSASGGRVWLDASPLGGLRAAAKFPR